MYCKEKMYYHFPPFFEIEFDSVKVLQLHYSLLQNLLDLQEVDAVIISTPWLWHTRMAKDTMLAGKYTGVEVSAANTMEECWDLVNTHEETGTHLMILENVR